jgi:hypothetical protein
MKPQIATKRCTTKDTLVEELLRQCKEKTISLRAYSEWQKVLENRIKNLKKQLNGKDEQLKALQTAYDLVTNNKN